MGTSTKTIQYRYDANRNRTLMIDPDGGRTTYSYDVLNRITSLINPQGERTTYAYDADGRRTVKKLANGTRASFTYDAANRLTTLANLKSDNSVISKFDYTYDKAGNRTGVTEVDGSRVTYLYDATYQLTGEHRTGTTPYRNTFTYDSRGNRTLKNETGTRTTYAYDDANQLVYAQAPTGRTTYTFDNNGNQTGVLAPNGDRTTTTWDYENRTTGVQLPSGTRNTMAYEPDGLRVKLEDSTGTKKFVWDQQNYLAETDQNNDTQVVYTNEPRRYGNLISQRRSGATSYYQYEALGSTRQLTDSSETVTDTYLYDAWGNVLTSSGSTVNPFQWTGNVGYYFDEDTGNFYIRARTYRPVIGRWLSFDPIGVALKSNLFRAYFIPSAVDPSGMIPPGYPDPYPRFDPKNPNPFMPLPVKKPKTCIFTMHSHEATDMERWTREARILLGQVNGVVTDNVRNPMLIPAIVRVKRCCRLVFIGHRGGPKNAGGLSIYPTLNDESDKVIVFPNDELEEQLGDIIRKNGCKDCDVYIYACGNESEKGIENQKKMKGNFNQNAGKSGTQCDLYGTRGDIWIGRPPGIPGTDLTPFDKGYYSFGGCGSDSKCKGSPPIELVE